MSRPAIFLALGLAITIIGIPSCRQSVPDLGSYNQPNILFIAVDDLNDWVAPLEGHPQALTPNLDKLAGQGISFTNAHCNCPACQPSRNSLMSGLMPETTGWYSNTWQRTMKRPVYDYIQEVSTALPEYFRQNGYRTMGAGKLYHSGVVEYEEDIERFWDEVLPPYTISAYFRDSVGDGYGEEDHFHPFPRGGSPINRHFGKRTPGFSLCGGPLDRDTDIPNGIMHDEYVAEWAMEKIAGDYDKPFFLAVGFTRPHVPYTAPREFFDLYKDMEIIIPEVPDDDLNDIPMLGKAMIPSILPEGDHATVLDMGPEYWKELVLSYLACVSFADAQVGRVLDALDESTHAENTIVVLWSDHGQHLGEKKHWRKMALWEESTRIPLVFRFPGSENAGKTSSRPVSLIDLYPTLVDLCGLPANAENEGRVLRPLLEQPDKEWDFPVVQSWMYGNFAVRSERFRYIRYRDGTEELYDHASDPMEWTNLAEDPAYFSIKIWHMGWVPEEYEPSFRMIPIPEDELVRNLRKWESEGLPDWLK